MEGSGVRCWQQERTQRIPSRNKTLRSSAQVKRLEAGRSNPQWRLFEPKLMEGPQATRKEASKQRREGTTQSVLASAGTPEGSGSWRIGRSGQGGCRAQAAVEAQGAKSGEMKSEDQKSKGSDPREVSPGDSLSFLAATRPGTAAMEGKPSEGDSRWRSRIAHCGEAAVRHREARWEVEAIRLKIERI